MTWTTSKTEAFGTEGRTRPQFVPRRREKKPERLIVLGGWAAVLTWPARLLCVGFPKFQVICPFLPNKFWTSEVLIWAHQKKKTSTTTITTIASRKRSRHTCISARVLYASAPRTEQVGTMCATVHSAKHVSGNTSASHCMFSIEVFVDSDLFRARSEKSFYAQ